MELSIFNFPANLPSLLPSPQVTLTTLSSGRTLPEPRTVEVNSTMVSSQEYVKLTSTPEDIHPKSELAFLTSLSLLLLSLFHVSGPLKQAIEKDFGSVDKLKENFNKQTAAVQGSGWGWLGYSPVTQKLESEWCEVLD